MSEPRDEDLQRALSTVTVDVAGLLPGQTRMFDFQRGGAELQGFVLNDDGVMRVYVNRCAHVPYSLDLGDGQVMSKDGEYIMCSSHGARFLPRTGFCFQGPPLGRSLEALPSTISGAKLVVTIQPEPEGWPNTSPACS